MEESDFAMMVKRSFREKIKIAVNCAEGESVVNKIVDLADGAGQFTHLPSYPSPLKLYNSSRAFLTPSH